VLINGEADDVLSGRRSSRHRVYNEATLFTLSSESLADGGSQDIDLENEAAWRQAIENSVIMPVQVWQDDSFTARIVLGDLHEDEESQWVGRVSWKLTIPCGRLALWAGVPVDDEYAHFVELPPGDYEVTSYCFTTSPNARFPGDDEPLGAYFRRTRPGEKFPPWLALRCAESPGLDPEQETQWERFVETERYELLCDVFENGRVSYVDFLIRLQPLDRVPAMPELTRPGFVETELRKPKLCPIGLYAQLGAGARETEGDLGDLFVDVAELDDPIESDDKYVSILEEDGLDVPMLDFIRSQISVIQVLQLIGFEVTGGNEQRPRGRCPLHQGPPDEGAFFMVNVAEDWFKRFKCRATGDSIALWAQFKKISINRAAIQLYRQLIVGNGRS